MKKGLWITYAVMVISLAAMLAARYMYENETMLRVSGIVTLVALFAAGYFRSRIKAAKAEADEKNDDQA